MAIVRLTPSFKRREPSVALSSQQRGRYFLCLRYQHRAPEAKLSAFRDLHTSQLLHVPNLDTAVRSCERRNKSPIW